MDDAGVRTRYIADVVDKANFKLDEMKRKAILDYAGSSEAHDRLVYDFGVPFRTGHRVLGALVRNHYLGEPPLGLRGLLKRETGRDIDVDEQEIMDIVLVKRLWPTTFDFPMLRGMLVQYRGKAKAAAEKFARPSIIEQASERVLADASAWLAAQKTA